MVKSKIDLLTDIIEADLDWPKYNPRSKVRFQRTLKMHYTERFGWSVATLLISRATGRRSGMQDGVK